MPDGLVSSVVWNMDCENRDTPVTTLAALNTEPNPTILPYPEVRRQEGLPPDPKMILAVDSFKNAVNAFLRPIF
jgi:hypothetical protein